MFPPIQYLPLSQLNQFLYREPNLELKNLGNLSKQHKKQIRRPALIGALTNIGISSLFGAMETELLPTLYQIFPNGTSNHEYQFLATMALSLVATGVSLKVTDYLSKNGVRRRDNVYFPAISITTFDTVAWATGKAKGLNNGYLGEVNKLHIFKGPVKEALMSEVKIGDMGLGFSIPHGLAGFSIFFCMLDEFKPDFKPILKAKKALNKIYDFASKSRLRKYAVQTSIGALLAISSGIPYLVAAPVTYDITKEYGKYALDKVRGKAEKFLSTFYRPKII